MKTTMYCKMCATVFLSLFLLSFGSCGIIIPEELPSLLSVGYSNIPPIKKGNDHRVGFGFAFGNHADLQVLLELGPQTNTKPLDGTPFGATSGSSNAKRQAPNVKINKNKEKFLHSDAGNYLQRWAEKMKHPQTTPPPIKDEIMNLEDSLVELVKNEKGEYEIHQPKPDHIPQEVLDNLKMLYGKKKEEARKVMEQKRSKDEVRRITEDLSNVDID
ncbi:uncharacterized protein LOC121727297 [Aricia agestis]|uniref:uncharacterized protein LOC121727297 n=1 Tax=Aricia agestis TaxID=91739 RepID=UPI001C205692|nr:uncharacterized protein LOC121727297 [Aricia agestis]